MSEKVTCYKADGTVSPDISCGFTSSSHCCGEGWDCLTNGLCRDHGSTAYSQGSCTDPSFINCLSFCNGDQFQGFTEVSRCDPNANSWCCAGAAGQGLGGVDCCGTNLTTSLEPYPLSTVEGSSTIEGSRTSRITTTTLRSASLTRSDEALTRSATSTSSSLITPTKSQSSPSVPPPSSTPSQPTNQNHESKTTGIKIGVPLAVVIALLVACLLLVILRRRNRNRKKRGSTDPQDKFPLTEHPELAADNTVTELDVTHYELAHPRAPRHELG